MQQQSLIRATSLRFGVLFAHTPDYKQDSLFKRHFIGSSGFMI